MYKYIRITNVILRSIENYLCMCALYRVFSLKAKKGNHKVLYTSVLVILTVYYERAE